MSLLSVRLHRDHFQRYLPHIIRLIGCFSVDLVFELPGDFLKFVQFVWHRYWQDLPQSLQYLIDDPAARLGLELGAPIAYGGGGGGVRPLGGPPVGVHGPDRRLVYAACLGRQGDGGGGGGARVRQRLRLTTGLVGWRWWWSRRRRDGLGCFPNLTAAVSLKLVSLDRKSVV